MKMSWFKRLLMAMPYGRRGAVLAAQPIDNLQPDRSVRYARRFLYAGACLCSFVCIGLMCVGLYMSFDHF